MSRLLELQDDGVERSIWAVRSMEEAGSLVRRLAEDAGRRNQAYTAKHFLTPAREKERHAAVLRQLLHAKPPGAGKRKAKGMAKRAKRNVSRNTLVMTCKSEYGCC
jgi:hypothetical protein